MTDKRGVDGEGAVADRVSDSVEALLTEDVADCWVCDCGVTEEVGNCGELGRDVVGCCVG